MVEHDQNRAPFSLRDEAHELLTEAHYRPAALLFERYAYVAPNRPESTHAFTMAGIAFALAGEGPSAVSAVFIAKTQSDTRAERMELEHLRVTVREIAEGQTHD